MAHDNSKQDHDANGRATSGMPAAIEAFGPLEVECVRLRPREAEQLQEIIIRAHYLSMELRDICASSKVGSGQLSLSASQMLKCWALAFSQELARTMDARG